MSFEALFENANRLPSIPKVLQELILSFNDPDTDLEKIAQKIALEPVITAKVLKVANSARYGSPRKISSIHEASVLLGFSAVRQIVLACGLVDALSIPQSLDKKEFWQRAFSIAGCKKWLCQYTSYTDMNTAFTAGLIHSMGELLMYVVYPEKTQDVAKKIDAGESVCAAQEAIYGYNHCVVGAELAKRWRFPDPICDALAQQHSALEFSPISPLAALLQVSGYIVSYHANQEDTPKLTETIPAQLASQLKLDLEKVTQDLTEIDSFDGGMASLLEDDA